MPRLNTNRGKMPLPRVFLRPFLVFPLYPEQGARHRYGRQDLNLCPGIQPVLYAELRKLASAYMSNLRTSHPIAERMIV